MTVAMPCRFAAVGPNLSTEPKAEQVLRVRRRRVEADPASPVGEFVVDGVGALAPLRP
jgi:hypothetical protein